MALYKEIYDCIHIKKMIGDNNATLILKKYFMLIDIFINLVIFLYRIIPNQT